MAEFESVKFNDMFREIIKKSLFTERQIEIILNKKGLRRREFSISRGAYYRQLGQSRDKLMRFYYTMVLLQSLGVILSSDIDVIMKLAESVSAIKDGDMFPERVGDVTNVIEQMDLFIRQQMDL